MLRTKCLRLRFGLGITCITEFSEQSDQEEGGITQLLEKNWESTLFLVPSLVQAALTRSLATMRTDFALVLTAALLLDTFWVRFFGEYSFFCVEELWEYEGATSRRAGVESNSS